jgi:malonate decarboxylase beta subunit
MRAVLDARAAGIPVVSLIGGANGCFGGMGIVTRCTNLVIMSEEGRLAMSGPEVIESANGVEEFDSRDRALVWRTTGGKHRYLLGDCDQLVADTIDAFRSAAIEALAACAGKPAGLTLEALESEQDQLAERLARFGALAEPIEIWTALGVPEPASVPMLDAERFVRVAAGHRLGAN